MWSINSQNGPAGGCHKRPSARQDTNKNEQGQGPHDSSGPGSDRAWAKPIFEATLRTCALSPASHNGPFDHLRAVGLWTGQNTQGPSAKCTTDPASQSTRPTAKAAPRRPRPAAASSQPPPLPPPCKESGPVEPKPAGKLGPGALPDASYVRTTESFLRTHPPLPTPQHTLPLPLLLS